MEVIKNKFKKCGEIKIWKHDWVKNQQSKSQTEVSGLGEKHVNADTEQRLRTNELEDKMGLGSSRGHPVR